METLNIPGTVKSEPLTYIRLGLQGAPSTGKTTSALTFPSPYVIDFDHKLPENINSAPFWNPEFIDTLIKRPTPQARANRRDGLKRWLRENITRISPDQTLILDSWTTMNNEFELYGEYDKTPYLTKKGEFDGFAFHKHKLIYNLEIVEFLKAAKCNIVAIFHEQIDRNDEGRPTGKLRPLLSGQMADQIAAHFTAWFRQVVNKKPNGEPKYDWVVRSNELFNAVTPHGFIMPSTGTIDANYKSLMACFKQPTQ